VYNMNLYECNRWL